MSIVTAVVLFVLIPVVVLWGLKVWSQPKGLIIASFLVTIIANTCSLLTFIFWIIYAETLCTGTLPTNFTTPVKGYSLGFILEVVACGLVAFAWILLLVSYTVSPKAAKTVVVSEPYAGFAAADDPNIYY